MDRTLPFTVRVTAMQAAVCLMLHFPGFKRVVDFLVLVLAVFNVLFLRIVPGHVEKLEIIAQTFSHGIPRYAGLARVLCSRFSRLAALGLTNQNLRLMASKLSRMYWPHSLPVSST